MRFDVCREKERNNIYVRLSSWGWQWFVFSATTTTLNENIKVTLLNELTQERRWSFVINMFWTFICLFCYALSSFDWWTRLVAGELFLIFMDSPGVLLLFLGCEGKTRQEVIESYASTCLAIEFLRIDSSFDGNRYHSLVSLNSTAIRLEPFNGFFLFCSCSSFWSTFHAIRATVT